MEGRDIGTLASELETTMALVRELVREVHAGAAADRLKGRLVELAEHLTRRPDLAALPSLVLRAYTEVVNVLGGIRQSRETFRTYTFERLTKGHDKLTEVSSATESATLELMNGIDRSLALLDQVATSLPPGSPGEAALETLRGEMNELFGHLQFQDITTQQLAGVGTLLEDIEARMQGVAILFNPRAGAQPKTLDNGAGGTFNPEASFVDVKDRQAMIDAAFAQQGPKDGEGRV